MSLPLAWRLRNLGKNDASVPGEAKHRTRVLTLNTYNLHTYLIATDLILSALITKHYHSHVTNPSPTSAHRPALRLTTSLHSTSTPTPPPSIHNHPPLKPQLLPHARPRAVQSFNISILYIPGAVLGVVDARDGGDQGRREEGN